jgi:hypothetical protein
MPLLDLKDFKKVINYITEEGKDEIIGIRKNIYIDYRNYSKLIELEQQELICFFWRNVLEIDDLMRIDENGKGYVNILQLISRQAKLFYFYAEFICQIYQQMPEKEMLISLNLLFY